MSVIPVYFGESFPDPVTKQLFLAGPTPRNDQTPSWRPEALRVLERLGYDGHVFVPEKRGGGWNTDYNAQIEWEEDGLKRADCILFWIPRVMPHMAGLTTNVEFGRWYESGKVVLGTPPEAEHVSYLRYYARKFNVPTSDTLEETAAAAIVMIGTGSERRGGACQMPIHIWNIWQELDYYQITSDGQPPIDFATTSREITAILNHRGFWHSLELLPRMPIPN